MLGIGNGARSGEPTGELLVPARDERCTLGNALCGCQCFTRHLVVSNHPRDQTLCFGLGGVENASFKQDF